MEKRLPPLILILFLFSSLLHAADDLTGIRIQLWAPYDEVPSLDAQGDISEDPLEHASLLLSQTGDFIVDAMVLGWNFDIVPGDATRRIEEYYEFTPLIENGTGYNIQYYDVVFQQDRITCWLEYDRNSMQMTRKAWWSSVNCGKSHGTGESRYTGTVDNLKEAVFKAAEDAVLEYVRKTEKNKPREITGSILLKDVTPQIKVQDGKYVADLDFFVHVDKIVQYSYF